MSERREYECPICGKTVRLGARRVEAEDQRVTHVKCSGCQFKFEIDRPREDPARYHHVELSDRQNPE